MYDSLYNELTFKELCDMMSLSHPMRIHPHSLELNWSWHSDFSVCIECGMHSLLEFSRGTTVSSAAKCKHITGE